MADAQEFEFDAFISYAARDRESFGQWGVGGFVERLEARLADHLGRRPRLAFDLERPEGAEGWSETIQGAVFGAAAMVILATPAWLDSPRAQEGFARFAETQRPVHSVLWRLPAEQLPTRLLSTTRFPLMVDTLSGTASQAAEEKLIGDLAEALASVLVRSPSPDDEEAAQDEEAAEAQPDEGRAEMTSTVRPLGADSGASVFYASPSEWDADWLANLRVGEILFWIKNGQPHLKRMRRGHTVVLLAGHDPTADDESTGAIIAIGALATGAEVAFTDGKNRRWPLLITHVFPRAALPRQLVEQKTGPLVRARGGGVHRLDITAAKALGPLLASQDGPSTIPLGPNVTAFALASGESVEAALASHPYIRRQDAPPGEPEPERKDAYVQLLSDAPSENQDLLDRGALALFLARRMHLIWCEANGYSTDPNAGLDQPPSGKARPGDTFIMHIDAPWGGGKTTFANFVARVLNPTGERLNTGHFLKSDIAPREADPRKLAATSLDGVFLRDYPSPHRLLHPPGRRPWIIVEANAWRDQYIQPPWWQIYVNVTQSIRAAILDDARRRFSHVVRRGESVPWRMVAVASGIAAWTRWLGTYAAGAWYTLTNVKVRRQLGLTAAAVLIVLAVYWGVLTPKMREEYGDASKLKGLLDLTVNSVAVLGGGLAALATVISQSIEPELEFSTETKHVGVRDPVDRFRATFDKILRLGRRPVLLIVDDLDRCEPKAVVELLRGFQTIVRSPRLFVMILGDRKWIENAHTVAYKELAALSGEGGPDLGVRFVEKLFQLSFTLPAMTPAMRRRYTLAHVGGAPEAAREAAVPATAQAKAVAEARASDAIDRALEDQAIPVRLREQQVSRIIAEAEKAGADTPELQAAASRKLVAAAGADVAYKKEVENILSGLGPLMPGNPRQIKRIINAFAVLETVGRLYFNYQLTGVGPDGERRARRWRQLALWVALAIDQPDVWRQLARRPQLLDAAFAPKATEKGAARKALLTGLDKAGVGRVTAEIERLSSDVGLRRLLGAGSVGEAPNTPAELFAQTRVESEAVREFNRIMWEPAFVVDD